KPHNLLLERLPLSADRREEKILLIGFFRLCTYPSHNGPGYARFVLSRLFAGIKIALSPFSGNLRRVCAQRRK
ncbi:MAG: hypothetical protein MJZ07_02670, partial [Bacteroidales bacterium]|nr:hypothetical protein [Bacteroidales bacterium]